MPPSRPSHDVRFVLRQLVEKDFKVRYRNMSLGIFWSLLNPLIMMTVMSFVFTVIFPNPEKLYPLFIMAGLLPYNFFSQSWSAATSSIVSNSTLVKKLSFPRELLPISVVLASSVHFFIQLALLMAAAVFFVGFSPLWALLPVIIVLHIIFTCGLALFFSALDVYYRDTQYVVESTTMVLFWVVPIFYSFEEVSRRSALLAELYSFNPLAAVIFLVRRVLIYQQNPGWVIIAKLGLISIAVFAVGLWFFRRMEREFVDHL